jgi:hypothetical protein
MKRTTRQSTGVVGSLEVITTSPLRGRRLRHDVLVQSEHVRRVVLALERDQAFVRFVAVRVPRASASPRKLTYARPVDASAKQPPGCNA